MALALSEMASHASIVRTRMRGGLLARVSGIIDETFSGDDLVTGASGIMVIDLGGVQRITSFGIRAWVQALKRLRADYYCLVNCQPNIVSQLNLVTGFAVKGEVVSFHAPFFCPECDESPSIVLDLRRPDHRLAVATLELPPVKCPSCGAACEFDDMPDLYFQYFRAAPMPNPPVLANAMIDGRETGQAFVIEKQIEDTITGLWMSGIMDKPGYFRRLADGLQGQVVVVTGEVEDATPQGLKAFRTFLATPDLAIFLARLPACLITALSSSSDRLGAARIVSLLLPFFCSHCARQVAISVPATAIKDPSFASTYEGYCPDCSHRAQPRLSDELIEAALGLPLDEPPANVRDYLAERVTSSTPEAGGRVDSTGTHPFGKYRVQKFLGSGGMGEVYLARQLGPGGFERLVVLKRIRADRLADNQAVDLFMQEAKLSARLSHPNIVQIFDFGKIDDGYFLTMEYVDGLDLHSVLALCRKLHVDVPVELACRIISDLCKGLYAAHHHKDEHGQAQPIIHRDVTTGNVLISVDGVVKLTDFGIAKASDSSNTTQPGLIKGTVRFIAPEVFNSPRVGSFRPTVDIYGAGVLLYECITCKPLFAGDTWASTLKAVLEQPIPRLSQHRIGISPHLERTFQRAVDRNPNKRHQDIGELGRELEHAIDELHRPAAPQDLAEWLRELLERRDVLARMGQDVRIESRYELEHEATAMDMAADATNAAGPAGSADPARTVDPVSATDPAAARSR